MGKRGRILKAALRRMMEMTVITAHFNGKYLIPDKPVKLPKGKTLRLRIDVAGRGSTGKKPYRLGSRPVKCSMSDASANPDKYIYSGM